MTSLVANNVSVEAGGTLIVKNASLSIRPGELVAILGANGAGKTSLLRALMGITATSSGTAQLNDRDCLGLAPNERAKLVSYLPQRRPLAWPLRVRDVIALGRFAHGAALGRLGETDEAAVNAAIESCKLSELKDRRIDNLSGGELARVHFARAIAAKTPLLVADEPVAELDPHHQITVADLIRTYVNNGGGALVILHEVALAARIADRLVWMKDGRIIKEGTPQSTLNAQTMEEVYGVQAYVSSDPRGFDIRIEAVS